MIRALLYDDTTGRLRGLPARDGLQWWGTHTVHAVGVGQQDMPVWVPYDSTLVAWRYRVATVGSGTGTLAAELRRGDTSTTLAGTSATPAVSPPWSTGAILLNADDLLWLWLSSHLSNPGTQLKAELVLERR